MNDTYPYDESHFIFTDAAWIIPTISGSVSTASSMLIMSVILRSSNESKFSSYHLIMLFMSFWDTISSAAIALTTIPMPSDVYDVYPFQGKAIGNVGTCVAQSFFIQLGTLFIFASNCCLNIYYLCTIRYGMSEEMMKKGVLPKMLILCTLVALPIPLQSLITHRAINPNPFMNYCGRCSYPILCDGDNSDKSDEVNTNASECIAVNDHEGFLSVLIIAIMGVTFFIMLFSLVLVVITVFQTEIALRRSRRLRRGPLVPLRINTRAQSRSSRIVANSTHEPESDVTRVLLLQACMYIAAFALTWVWFVVMIIKNRRHENGFVPGRNFIIARSIFRPLQGFFNAIIFIYQKAYTLRRADRSLPFMSAIFLVIKSPKTVPGMLISGIALEDEADGDGHELEYEHGAAPGYTSNIIVMRRRGLGGSGIRSLGSDATQGEYNSNDDSDDSNIDVASVAAQSDLEEYSSSPDALDHDDFCSSLTLSSPSVGSESEAGLSSTSYYLETRRLATVQEESEECHGGDDGCASDNDAADDDEDEAQSNA